MHKKEHTSRIKVYHFGGFKLDTIKHSLVDPNGKVCSISSRALDALIILIEQRGQPVSKNVLLESVWPDTIVEENNLNQAISCIRKALGDSKLYSQYIKTFPGKGYSFVASLDAPEECREKLEGLSPDPSLATYIKNGGLVRDTRTNRYFLNHNMFAALLIVITVGVGAYYLGSSLSNLNDSLITSQTTSNTATLTKISVAKKPKPNSMAILPYTDLTPLANQQKSEFALILHDELINELSQQSNLKIISRESVLSPLLHNQTPQEIGELLNVEHLLTGTIVFENDRARLNIHIQDPVTNLIEWSYDYELKNNDIESVIEMQHDIARGISQAFNIESEPSIRSNFLSRTTNSFKAYRYNMAAINAYYSQNFAKTLELSNKALSIDPNYSGALYNYSLAHYYLASNPIIGMTSRDHINRVSEAANRLIKLTPEKHEGYVLKALAEAINGNWYDGAGLVNKLKELNAPLWDLDLLVPVLMSLGEYQTTIEILEANLQVEPLNSFSRGFLMAAYEGLGNSIQARLEYEIGEDLTPNWWGDIVSFFLRLGWDEPPVDDSNAAGISMDVTLVTAELVGGNRENVLSLLNEALYRKAEGSSKYVHYAAIAAAIKEHGLAIQFMTKATNILPVHLHWVWLPIFNETRKHPDFDDFIKSTGVDGYWVKNGPPELCLNSSNLSVCNSEFIFGKA